MPLPKSLEYITQIDDWSEKYEIIMELGQKLKPLHESQKINSTRIKGCQSRVWLVLGWIDNKLQISTEADSRLVQGLLAMVIEVYGNKNSSEIEAIDREWIEELGLSKNISMVRQNGLLAVIDRIQEFAVNSVSSL
jgi:cysteine desulfuration protein SufE